MLSREIKAGAQNGATHAGRWDQKREKREQTESNICSGNVP